MTDARALSDALATAVAAASSAVARVTQPHSPPTSGLVLADDLIVASSYRVADGPVEVAIDGDDLPATLVGRDPGTDIALLRVGGGGLAAPSFRDPDGLRVGELALALGRPGKSVRASLRLVGVLSPEPLRTPAGGRLERYVETDRAIPRGFSGGPLVDVDGKVLGMNTRALFRGADVAVPANTLRRVADALLADGTVARGYLGVGAYAVRLPRHLAAQLGQEAGALVVAVDEGAPAEAAGLLIGDILTSIGDVAVTGPGSLRDALLDRAGATVELKLIRAGAPLALTATIGRRSP